MAVTDTIHALGALSNAGVNAGHDAGMNELPWARARRPRCAPSVVFAFCLLSSYTMLRWGRAKRTLAQANAVMQELARVDVSVALPLTQECAISHHPRTAKLCWLLVQQDAPGTHAGA